MYLRQGQGLISLMESGSEEWRDQQLGTIANDCDEKTRDARGLNGLTDCERKVSPFSAPRPLRRRNLKVPVSGQLKHCNLADLRIFLLLLHFVCTKQAISRSLSLPPLFPLLLCLCLYLCWFQGQIINEHHLPCCAQGRRSCMRPVKQQKPTIHPPAHIQAQLAQLVGIPTLPAQPAPDSPSSPPSLSSNIATLDIGNLSNPWNLGRAPKHPKSQPPTQTPARPVRRPTQTPPQISKVPQAPGTALAQIPGYAQGSIPHPHPPIAISPYHYHLLQYPSTRAPAHLSIITEPTLGFIHPLHSAFIKACRRPLIPHSLLCTFQSNLPSSP